MNVNEAQRRLLRLCAIRVGKSGLDWSLIAREASTPGGLDELEAGRVSECSEMAAAARRILASDPDHGEAADRVDRELEAADMVGARLITVLDEDYPANLRLIWNLPPFLFLRGTIRSDDLRSVAVVGTRDASSTGLERARRMAALLVANGVTVVSGLARGIDTAAHTSALDNQGRTISVIGTGITRTYPAENRALAERIIDSGGAVVSQFWPTAGPTRWTFPRRNVVMSGIAQGTVVIEASSTSGAKMQARLALEHGKKAFLVESLVMGQPWARRYVDARGAIVVRAVDDVLMHLARPESVSSVAASRQLTLDLAGSDAG